MDEGMMQGGAPRSMRSPGFAARGFLRHEAEFPGSQTSLAADAPAITFQRSKSISNLEVFDIIAASKQLLFQRMECYSGFFSK